MYQLLCSRDAFLIHHPMVLTFREAGLAAINVAAHTQLIVGDNERIVLDYSAKP
jgi:hypothetical protein